MRRRPKIVATAVISLARGVARDLVPLRAPASVIRAAPVVPAPVPQHVVGPVRVVVRRAVPVVPEVAVPVVPEAVPEAAQATVRAAAREPHRETAALAANNVHSIAEQDVTIPVLENATPTVRTVVAGAIRLVPIHPVPIIIALIVMEHVTMPADVHVP